jgi:hypothetical protein
VLKSPPVYTVIGGIKSSLTEPRDVAGLEGARLDGVEWAIPVQHLAGFLRFACWRTRQGCRAIGGLHLPTTLQSQVLLSRRGRLCMNGCWDRREVF